MLVTVRGTHDLLHGTLWSWECDRIAYVGMRIHEAGDNNRLQRVGRSITQADLRYTVLLNPQVSLNNSVIREEPFAYKSLFHANSLLNGVLLSNNLPTRGPTHGSPEDRRPWMALVQNIIRHRI